MMRFVPLRIIKTEIEIKSGGRKGRLYHAVRQLGERLLGSACGTGPGEGSQWDLLPGKTVTCPSCLRNMFR